MTVFRVLFEQWTEFCKFREGLPEESVLPTIERQLRKAKTEEKRKRKKQETKREKVKLPVHSNQLCLVRKNRGNSSKQKGDKRKNETVLNREESEFLLL